MFSRKRQRRKKVLEVYSDESSESSIEDPLSSESNSSKQSVSNYHHGMFSSDSVSEKATDGQSESNDSNSSKSSNRELVEEKQDEKGSDRDEFKPGYKPDVDGCVIENSKDYRLMCYVNFARTEGLSAGTLQRLDALMETLYGAPPVFTSMDVSCVLKNKKKVLSKN